MADEKGFRADIQGLRGVSVLLVLAAHAELPGFAGGYIGLTVFYVLSGFLITGLILSEVQRHGRVSIPRFYARRAKRLLPAAATVLTFCAVGAAALYSPAEIQKIAEDILAAALYVVNWHFIAESVDYFTGDASSVSPVQHFWSLSVEEQFYFVWPLVMGLGALLARRLGLGVRKSIALLLVPIAIGSLIYSLDFTATNPRDAYFSTFARAWELAFGAALALILPAGLRMRRPLPALLAGGGIALLIATALIYDEATPYPGWQAALPVGAVLAILIAGTATAVSVPMRLLKTGVMQYLGRISYSLYLWHWPVLIFAGVIWAGLETPALVAIVSLSAIPAILTHHFIEEPFRRSPTLARRPRRALALGATCTGGAVCVAIALQIAFPPIPTASPELARGAQTMGPLNPKIQTVSAVRPNPVDATADKGQLFEDGCLVLHEQIASGPCVYGNPRSDVTVVAFGDSHTLQWFPPLLKLAERRDWRLVGLTRAGCVVAQVRFNPPCDTWRRNSMRRIRRERPDLVVVSTSTGGRYQVRHKGRRLSREASEPLLVTGFARTLRRLKRTGAEVVVIRDQALAPFLPSACVSENSDDLSDCSFRPERRRGRAFDAFGAGRADVQMIDPIEVFCPQRRCPPVIGNVMVYRDTYHMTATFARTLTPWLARKLPLPLREKRPPVERT